MGNENWFYFNETKNCIRKGNNFRKTAKGLYISKIEGEYFTLFSPEYENVKWKSYTLNFLIRFDEEYIAKSIKCIKKVYADIKVGGYGGDEYDGEKELEIYQPKSRREISPIWSANLFPPSEVQKYGREKLLKAPCELIEEWEDGAIFMMIHKDRFSSIYEERKKLRAYLGAEQ